MGIMPPVDDDPRDWSRVEPLEPAAVDPIPSGQDETIIPAGPAGPAWQAAGQLHCSCRAPLPHFPDADRCVRCHGVIEAQLPLEGSRR